MVTARPGAALEARLAAAYGVEIETSTLWPARDAEPAAVFGAAEQIAKLLGDVGARPPTIAEPSWSPLPVSSSSPPSASERAAAIARMEAWAVDAGVRLDGIELHVDPGGDCSVRARRAIAAGERIVTVPRRLMILDNELAATPTGDTDPFGSSLQEPRDTLSTWLPLEARRSDSPWRPLLDVLPGQFADLPVFRGGHDLDGLAGTAARAVAADAHRDVIETYGRLRPELRARLSLADFAWGRAVVQSRGFNAPVTTDHRIALIPVVDMFNHGLDDTTWHYSPADRTYVITTLRGFAAGDEVNFDYGTHSNARLLVSYGFALPRNPASEGTLVFAAAADPCSAIAAHLLWELPLAASTPVIVATVFDDRFRRALSIARLHVSRPLDRALAARTGLPDHEMPWLGAELERAALAEIAAAARRGIDRLERHDPAPAVSSWSRTCAVVRAGEREVLEQIIDFALTAAPHLSSPAPAPALLAAADAIPPEALGAQRLLRHYLHALGYELTND